MSFCGGLEVEVEGVVRLRWKYVHVGLRKVDCWRMWGCDTALSLRLRFLVGGWDCDCDGTLGVSGASSEVDFKSATEVGLLRDIGAILCWWRNLGGALRLTGVCAGRSRQLGDAKFWRG